MSSFLPAGGSGTGGGILYPDSAARPFASNSARNTWANNNKADLIKDTTVVNVGGNQWYLWTGESNPDTVNNNLWMDADQIVPGEKGDRGDPGIDVTTAVVNADGDLIVTLSNGNDINAGRARGEDGDLVYQQLPAADYANFFDADWSTLGTNIYGVTALGSQFANAPFPLNASTTYSFECLLVNEPNQYSLRVTSMANADFENAGRDAILSGLTKTAAEAVGWKVYAFTSDPGHADPTEGFDLQPNADIGLDSTSALTIKNNAGDVHNAVDQDINLDAIRLGSPVMRTYLRTGADRMQVQTTNGLKDIAHLEDIPPAGGLDTFLINDDDSSHLRTGAGVNSTFDAATGEHTLTVDPMSVDGNPAESMVMGSGIQSAHDPVTNEVTLTVDPTNVDLTGYAELETDVAFSKVSVKNPTDPLFESVINVTNGGNTEANLVGTTNIRKVDKATGVATDVIGINGTSGAVDLKTDVTYQGSITDDKAPVTKEYLEAFGRGLGVPQAVDVSGGNTYQQESAVASFTTVGTDINDVLIQIDPDLLEAETIITVPSDSSVTTKNFDVEQNAGEGTTRNIRAGDTWRVRMIVDQGGVNHWFWDRAYTGGGNVVYGLAGRNDIIDEVGVKAFAYAEGMPYHLLLETPTSSRLFHEFPREKTFRFTPISTGREHDNNVVINQANQGVANADLELGQYSDLPLYVIEPNVVVNRDQRAWINFPANMTLDVSAGFYAFGTVSGWCGNNTTEGNVAVYVGNSEDFRSYAQNIGFVLGNSGVFILDGQNLRTAQNSAALQFDIEPGVTHMYRYAFYVDNAGLMTYYIVDLNTGQLSTGTQQCNLGSLGSNPKLYVSYDRYNNNTAAIAIAETHLVVNPVGNGEGRWNWRN